MTREILRQHAGVDVVAATGRKPDHDAHGLAAVERGRILSGCRRGNTNVQRGDCQGDAHGTEFTKLVSQSDHRPIQFSCAFRRSKIEIVLMNYP